jgi:glycosyltransferase involved in cell wall biosynthesis
MTLLAHGLPIVTTTPCVPILELVACGRGQNICLVQAAHPPALAEAIAALATDEARRHKLGEGARQLSHRFGGDGIAWETLALYAEQRSPAFLGLG